MTALLTSQSHVDEQSSVAQRESSADDALQAYVQAGRLPWPDFDVSERMFLAHVRTRCVDGQLPPIAYAADLFLACACTHGDPRARVEFVARCTPIVTRVLARRCSNAALAQDASQVIHEQLLVGIEGDRPKIAEFGGRGPLHSWVATVAAKRVLMLQRSTSRRGHNELASTAFVRLRAIDRTPELSFLQHEYGALAREAITDALEALDDRARALLGLHLEGVSIDRIGAMYHVNRATAARWLSAARSALVHSAKSRLCVRLRIGPSECDSILALVQSQADVPLRTLLHASLPARAGR